MAARGGFASLPPNSTAGTTGMTTPRLYHHGKRDQQRTRCLSRTCSTQQGRPGHCESRRAREQAGQESLRDQQAGIGRAQSVETRALSIRRKGRYLPLRDEALSRCRCLKSAIVLLPRKSMPTQTWSRPMRLISSLMVCLALSACATDYVSQLYQPNYGLRGLKYTESNIDPTLLMNGSYASKQTNGFYGSSAFCLTDYRCSPLAQQRSSGWDP
jgi:hypothetical protein